MLEMGGELYRQCEWTNHDGSPSFDAADLMWCVQLSVGLGADGKAYCQKHLTSSEKEKERA